MAARNSDPDRSFANAIAGRQRLKAAGDAWERENVDLTGRRSSDTIRVYDGDQIGYLLKRRSISMAQWAAGDWLWQHWYNGGLAASGIVDLTKPVVDGGRRTDAVAVHQLAHRMEYAKALSTIEARHARILTAVVIGNMGLFDYAGRFGRYSDKTAATAVAMELLRHALTDLDAYRLDPDKYRRQLALRAASGQSGRAKG